LKPRKCLKCRTSYVCRVWGTRKPLKSHSVYLRLGQLMRIRGIALVRTHIALPWAGICSSRSLLHRFAVWDRRRDIRCRFHKMRLLPDPVDNSPAIPTLATHSCDRVTGFSLPHTRESGRERMPHRCSAPSRQDTPTRPTATTNSLLDGN
jgi:hypothetical protein